MHILRHMPKDVHRRGPGRSVADEQRQVGDRCAPQHGDPAANKEHGMSTPVISGASRNVSTDVEERLARLLDKVVTGRGVQHASIAIASGDGRRYWAGAAGPADRHGTPLRPDTPFFVASITKRFIVTLVLQCHERGELHLDDPISRWLPGPVLDGLHVLGGVDHTGAITVRHLATHTSGLPDYFEKRKDGSSLFRMLAGGQDLPWTFDDVVRWTKEQHAPHFAPQDLTAPRQKARYSDTGFQLLIRLVEEATGRSFGDLLVARILEPLGLEQTWLPGRTTPLAGDVEMATIFAKDRPLDVPQLVRSSNDLGSSNADLVRFNRALLAGELFHDPATVAILTERRNRLRNAIALRYGTGTMLFGVHRLSAPGPRAMTLAGHSGATGTWLFHCPELDVHLAGTIDQAEGRAQPFRIMVRMLRAWYEPS
jgi:D-alanyl-D-alanine carboxypeptidase